MNDSGGRKGQLALAAFFHPTGHHVASWLHPESQIDAGTNFRHYVQLAQTAERAHFDFIFLADSSAVRHGNLNALRRWPQYMAYFEPITLLSALAAVTEHIGLIATATTSYNEPFHVARKYASLDHISGGRAGWNVVTSGNLSEAWNFGRVEHYEHDNRYDRAREFVRVVQGLWDSWDDDVFVRDRESAIYFDPAKLHVLNHTGEHFSVRGPLNVARSPQGYPVIVQAGSSETGKEFAAEYAEVIFTTAETFDKAKAFYEEVKSRMAKFGRARDHLKIMAGFNPVIGQTDAEAEEKHQFLQSKIHPEVGLELLSAALGGFDLSRYPLDGPLPDIPETKGSKGHFKQVVDMARVEGLTIRQIYMRYAGARGNRTVKGTPTKIADEMEHWFRNGAIDGFLIQPPHLPGGLDEFVATVIPELQRRGLFRRSYTGRTLRENLGLPRPVSRYAKQPVPRGAG
ncbi:MAG: LLM class flavin-dependent oxidoreductase [Alphaproteobacteria bacterium]|nr:LLM class flavin-dependent oxidoreductase [Alphaproteobacteria bacterium]